MTYEAHHLARIAVALERLCDHFIPPDVEAARAIEKRKSFIDEKRAAAAGERLCPGYGSNPRCVGVKSKVAAHCWKCKGMTRKGGTDT